jgi:membrane-anchored protein YejM (alkaline phosphatase superfamily)
MNTIHRDSLRTFWLGNFIVVIWLLAAMIGSHFTSGFSAFLFSALLAFCYALLFLLPGLVLTRLVGLLSFWFAAAIGILYATGLIFALNIDARLYAMYGFHFNGFVWNLLTTPGGFASLDSSASSNFDLFLQIGLVVVLEVVWLLLCSLAASKQWTLSKTFLKRILIAWVVLLVICQLAFGFARILNWSPAINAAQQIPFFIHTKVRGIADIFGIKVVRQQDVVKEGRLNYPLAPIVSDNHPWSPNFIWLVSESLRADMLTPEIMPNLWQFAQTAHRFTNHYSGGNGTRQGVFSMFYSLPGNYWFAFLNAQREPVFIQLLQSRGYQFGLYTSSKFTYPEFNRTLFARFPASELHAHDTEPTTWQNDIYNTKQLLTFMDQARQKPQPFFLFMFFNSPHARYQFPDYSVIRPDYLKHFNYAREDVAEFKHNIKQIKNRYINSVHFLDMQLGKIFAYVKEHDLRKDTIIIITGDHAEEFMDEGRWGHNSELHNYQIHTPMVLWIPGKGHGVHDYPTSHLDFIPTIMPLMGVTTPVADYSEGDNLLHPTPDRYRLSANWDHVAYIGSKYKVVLPVRNAGLTGPKYLTADDKPVQNLPEVKAQLQGKIMQVLKDISRFYKKGD